MKPMHVVEAALFSAGRPLAVEEIVERTGLKAREVERAVADLKAAYAERDTVLEVGRAGTKWAMQVRTQAAEPAAKFAPMEIPEKLLKTLALIAYHQPMKQSELSDMIGSKVYDHVRELHERGLVKTRAEGVTKILTTTPAFPEYFGLEAATPDEIRQVMGRLVGIEAAPKRKEKRVESFATAGDAEGAQLPDQPPDGADAAAPPTGGKEATDPPGPSHHADDGHDAASGPEEPGETSDGQDADGARQAAKTVAAAVVED